MALVLRAKQASQESLRYLILSLLAFSAQVNQVKVAEHSYPVKFVLFITKNIIFKKEKAHFLHLHKYMLIALLLWPQALPALGHLALLLRPLHTCPTGNTSTCILALISFFSSSCYHCIYVLFWISMNILNLNCLTYDRAVIDPHSTSAHTRSHQSNIHSVLAIPTYPGVNLINLFFYECSYCFRVRKH